MHEKLYTAVSGLCAEDEKAGANALRRAIAPHGSISPARSILQIATSVLPLFALYATMYVTAAHSIWLTLALAIPTAGFIVRTFILQHDCGHGALFHSRQVNDWVGRACSLLTLTPYDNWRRQHGQHHANWNNLDRRESGADIYSACLTVAEYGRLSRGQRALYRIVRNPLIALVLLPPLIFIVLYRLPFDTPAAWRRERFSVHATNVALAVLVIGLGLWLGFGRVALVQLPAMTVASIVGVWLFSVQHRFEGATWLRRDEWTPAAASLRGTSYLRLPRWLHWFTGNIGYHHVHHLNPRIPNYRLAACHASSAALRTVPTLSLGTALSSSLYWLWDEDRQRMVRFGESAGDRGGV